MPRVLQRITALSLRYPGRMALAIACSLGAAVASLTCRGCSARRSTTPRRCSRTERPTRPRRRRALLTTALLVIAATVIRGVLTMMTGYQSEYVSQRVGYDLRLHYFQQLQRLSASASTTAFIPAT